jgi:hypothetical protein
LQCHVHNTSHTQAHRHDPARGPTARCQARMSVATAAQHCVVMQACAERHASCWQPKAHHVFWSTHATDPATGLPGLRGHASWNRQGHVSSELCEPGSSNEASPSQERSNESVASGRKRYALPDHAGWWKAQATHAMQADAAATCWSTCGLRGRLPTHVADVRIGAAGKRAGGDGILLKQGEPVRDVGNSCCDCTGVATEAHGPARISAASQICVCTVWVVHVCTGCTCLRALSQTRHMHTHTHASVHRVPSIAEQQRHVAI